MKRARFNEAERRVLHLIANAFEQVNRQPGGNYNLTGSFGFVPGGAAERRAFASLVRKKLIKRVRSEGHFQYQLTNKGVHLIARPFIRQVARHTRTGNPGRGRLVQGPGTHRQRYWKTQLRLAEADLDEELDSNDPDPQAVELLREYIDEVKRHVRGESTVLEGRGIGKRRYYSGGRYEHRKRNRKRNPGRTTAQRAGAAWASASTRKQREIIRRLGLDRWKYGNVTPNADYALVQSAALDMGLYNELEDELLGTGLGRKRNPGTKKRRKIVSQAQWRALAAKMNRGEISKRDFDDMVKASRPFRRLPKRKGSRRRNPSDPPPFGWMPKRDADTLFGRLRKGDKIDLKVQGHRVAAYTVAEDGTGRGTIIAKRGFRKISVSPWDFSEGFARLSSSTMRKIAKRNVRRALRKRNPAGRRRRRR